MPSREAERQQEVERPGGPAQGEVVSLQVAVMLLPRLQEATTLNPPVAKGT